MLIHVLSDLQSAMGGKKTIWRTLETKDHAEAKRRRVALLDHMNDEIGTVVGHDKMTSLHHNIGGYFLATLPNECMRD